MYMWYRFGRSGWIIRLAPTYHFRESIACRTAWTLLFFWDSLFLHRLPSVCCFGSRGIPSLPAEWLRRFVQARFIRIEQFKTLLFAVVLLHGVVIPGFGFRFLRLHWSTWMFGKECCFKSQLFSGKSILLKIQHFFSTIQISFVIVYDIAICTGSSSLTF